MWPSSRGSSRPRWTSSRPSRSTPTRPLANAEDVRPLRLAILRAGQPPESAVWPGDDDPRAHHVVVDGLAVGSVLPQPDGSWRVRGMSTAPDARVRAQGATLVWCNARPRALSLYERAGFVAVGEPWDDPELGPHQRMELQI